MLGSEMAKALNPVEFEKYGLRVKGFLAPPDVQRTNSQHLFLFVNNRPVWDRLLQRAVLTAYEALIPRGKFPVAVLFVEIAPSQVDVNVHPAKREIRFRNPGEVIETVREAVLGYSGRDPPKNLPCLLREPFFRATAPRDLDAGPDRHCSGKRRLPLIFAGRPFRPASFRFSLSGPALFPSELKLLPGRLTGSDSRGR